MERNLFIALNLHLLPEKQLFLLLCIISLVEGLILISFMHYIKKFYVSLPEFVWVFFCMPFCIYLLFMIEHLTFFSCIIYIQLFYIIIYFITKQYKIADLLEEEKKDE